METLGFPEGTKLRVLRETGPEVDLLRAGCCDDGDGEVLGTDCSGPRGHSARDEKHGHTPNWRVGPETARLGRTLAFFGDDLAGKWTDL